MNNTFCVIKVRAIPSELIIKPVIIVLSGFHRITSDEIKIWKMIMNMASKLVINSASICPCSL